MASLIFVLLCVMRNFQKEIIPPKFEVVFFQIFSPVSYYGEIIIPSLSQYMRLRDFPNYSKLSSAIYYVCIKTVCPLWRKANKTFQCYCNGN